MKEELLMLLKNFFAKLAKRKVVTVFFLYTENVYRKEWALPCRVHRRVGPFKSQSSARKWWQKNEGYAGEIRQIIPEIGRLGPIEVRSTSVGSLPPEGAL